MTTIEIIDLEQMRKLAKISQEDMAKNLDLSQSQVSRYEKDPENVPLGIVKKWAAYCGSVSTQTPLSYGDPYKEVRNQLKLMEEYATTAPEKLEHKLLTEAPPTATNFLCRMKEAARKPRIALCGRFDMGKSRMANTLLGGDKLPTAYQPATSVICLIRHINDRPSWLREDVWIMGKDFDLNKADDEAHCMEYKIFAGSFDTLARYGTHNCDTQDEDLYAALVFIDSPFLLGCDIVDLPGYGNSDSDYDKAEFARHIADAVIYAATAQGFLNVNDLEFLRGILKQLPPIGTVDNSLSPLQNVFIVATLAKMEPKSLEEILDKSSSRAFKHLEDNLTSRSEKPITHTDFRKRFFTFLVENQSVRQDFETDVAQLLSSAFPDLVRKKLDRIAIDLKNVAKQYCESWASRFVEIRDKQELARENLSNIEKENPERQRRIDNKNKRILAILEENKNASRQFIRDSLFDMTTPKAIETMILKRYKDDKEEAKSLAGSYLTEHIQNKLSGFLAKRADELTPEIEALLNDYQNSNRFAGDIKIGAMSVPFNARGVFLGALAGAGTAGALAAWASVVAAGSNLGAYLLVPTVVGYLSTIGISIAGGTASAVSLVAALGGPITIMIGLAAGVAALVWSILGPSWQTRLSKKVSEELGKLKFIDKLVEHTDKYWDDTKRGYSIALKETEKKFKETVDVLRQIVNSTSTEEINNLIHRLEVNRDFFGGIPWRSAG